MGIEAGATWKDSVITSYRDHCTHLGRGGSVLEVMAGKSLNLPYFSLGILNQHSERSRAASHKLNRHRIHFQGRKRVQKNISPRLKPQGWVGKSRIHRILSCFTSPTLHTPLNTFLLAQKACSSSDPVTLLNNAYWQLVLQKR